MLLSWLNSGRYHSASTSSFHHIKFCPVQSAEPEKKPHPCKDQGFYIKLGSGPSFANEAEIKAPLSIWDTAAEGYNGSLGTAPIILAGLGYDSPFVSTDITASYRPNYNYKKYQTPTTTDTIGELGSTTRRFTLDVASIMETIYLNGPGMALVGLESRALFFYFSCNWRRGWHKPNEAFQFSFYRIKSDCR